jgi:hypothetical protein
VFWQDVFWQDVFWQRYKKINVLEQKSYTELVIAKDTTLKDKQLCPIFEYGGLGTWILSLQVLNCALFTNDTIGMIKHLCHVI